MTVTTRRSFGKRSPPTTRAATRRSPTKPSGMRTNSERATVTAGRKTRPGNIRCPSAPISALLCARRASSSTSPLAQGFQHVQAQRAREVARAAAGMVDLGHQGGQRQAAGPGERAQFLPESVLQGEAGAMAVDGDRAFAHFLALFPNSD